MDAQMVLNVTEFLDFLLAEQALENVLEAAGLVVDAEALNVVLRKLLGSVVRGHFEFVWVHLMLFLVNDVTGILLLFLNVVGCNLRLTGLLLGCLQVVKNY